jgi:hypothetical protein
VKVILSAHKTIELLKEHNTKEYDIKTPFSKIQCGKNQKEEHNFEENNRRIEGGRFKVGLPKLKKIPGDTYSVAFKWQLALKRKMERDEEFKEKCHKSLKEYKEDRYMSKVCRRPVKEGRR